MMFTIDTTNEHEREQDEESRIVVKAPEGRSWVGIELEAKRKGRDWRTDPEAGLIVERAQLGEFIEALQTAQRHGKDVKP